MNSGQSFLKNVLDYFGNRCRTLFWKSPDDRSAIIANLSHASAQLLSDVQSAQQPYLIVSPALVASLLALLASDVDSLKETLISILASIMGITAEDVNFLLHNCDPTPPCWTDKSLLKEFCGLPAIQQNLAESVERLIKFIPLCYSDDPCSPFFFPFSSLYFISTLLNCVSTLPKESPLRASFLLFLQQYARRTTIIEHISLYNTRDYQIFLTTSFRRFLLRLTQFLSDEDTSSVLQIILSHYKGFNDSKNDFLRNYIQQEVELLLPESSRPSQLRIETIRSYLLTLSNRNFNVNSRCEHLYCRHSQHDFVSDTFIDLLDAFVREETPTIISGIRLRSFPYNVKLPDNLAWDLFKVIPRCESLECLDFCFWLLSKQEFCNTERPLELHMFVGVVEKAAHLIRNDLSIQTYKQVFTTLQKCVNWDQLGLPSMFHALLPLLSETADVIAHASAQLFSDEQSTPQPSLFVSPAFVTSILALLASDIDSLKETLVSILASIMGITPENVNCLLHNCDPTPPCLFDKMILDRCKTIPTTHKSLAESLEKLMMSESFRDSLRPYTTYVLPFSSLFFISTVLNCVSILPKELPLRASLLLFLQQNVSHQTILEHISLYNNSEYQVFLSTSFRRNLLRLTQFMSDEDTSSILQMILSHNEGLNDSKHECKHNSIKEEMEILLPDPSRPSQLRIESIRSYLQNLSDLHFSVTSNCDLRYSWRSHFLKTRHQFVKDAFLDLVSDFVQEENPRPILALRLRSFPTNIQLPVDLAWKMFKAIPRCKSLKSLDFCFWLLSKQDFCNKKRHLEPHLFVGVVEKATHLIRNHHSIKLHKQVIKILQMCVEGSQLELSSMFHVLLPLLSEILVVISKRRRVNHHTEFLHDVVDSGIHKLDTPDLSEPQCRFITSSLIQLGLTFPTVRGTNRIMSSFANEMNRGICPWKKRLKDLIVRIMVEEGCEDLFASAPLKFHSKLRFRAVMNCPNIRSTRP
ncbi:hypothetical protein BLNAU_4816 [Blattamonas nauphoetae]|uniref:Uncharacterized protein n=1 Tax=Blattamonas nauphoetae TaxID=2049346 RepID=A0ABQ9Y990_9EUKA|nr:hypothetical protein BLNAU_4816 [Blattamonas nauphoetae]